jgi:small-conductance mechanosensitive channel
MPDLNLDRVADLITTHPLASLIGALLLGLAAPARVRRIARWAVVATFWIVVLAYLVPVGVLWFALYVVGIRVVPGDDDLPPLSTQLPLPFDR